MKPLHINFKPSMLLFALITLMSTAASGILILLAWSWQIKLLLVLIILISSAYVICERGLLLLPWSVVELHINSNNDLQLTRRDGLRLANLQVRKDSVVTPYLTILHYHPGSATLLRRAFTPHLIILPDAIDTESFRKIRVWLLWGCAPQQQLPSSN